MRWLPHGETHWFKNFKKDSLSSKRRWRRLISWYCTHKHFVVLLILVYSFQICVYFVFATKSNIQEACCLKIFIGRVLTEVIKETSCSKKYLLPRVDNLISAPNFHCCHFSRRAVPWLSPLEFVCKSRVESGVQCVWILMIYLDLPRLNSQHTWLLNLV